jgi:hypothetical protein
MVLTQRHAFILGGIAAFLLAFWYVDMPSTVRLKTSILKVLPMTPAALNQSIRSVCAGSYAGMDVVTCYSNFQSEEAEAAVAADERCVRFKGEMSARPQDWLEHTRPAPTTPASFTRTRAPINPCWINTASWSFTLTTARSFP